MHGSQLNARAFWITQQEKSEIREEPLLRPPSKDEQSPALIRTLYSAVSRGTERLVYKGNVPQSEHRSMRAPHQQGVFPWPVKYGYCNVGEVIESSSSLAIGQRVFGLFPHQDRYFAFDNEVNVVPTKVSTRRALLAANMETALNGVWDGELKPGDNVAVVGAGVIGCLVAYLAAKTIGCSVQLIDIDASKAHIASLLGVPFCSPDDAVPERDLVFHASASEAGIHTALSLAGTESRVIELSWFGSRQVALPLGHAFHAKRLTIRSSQVGQLPVSQRPRWTYQRRMQLALNLLEDSTLEHLLAPERSFEELPTVMKELCAPGNATLCQPIRYRH